MSGIGAGDEEHAAGVTIEAMDDAGALVAIRFRERPEAVQQGVHERALMVARTEMNHHAGRFVDGDHGRILIEHADGNVFGERAQRCEFSGLDFHRLAAPQRHRRLRRRHAIHAYAPGLDPILHARPRVAGKLLLQEMVKPFGGVGGLGLKRYGTQATNSISTSVCISGKIAPNAVRAGASFLKYSAYASLNAGFCVFTSARNAVTLTTLSSDEPMASRFF